MSRRVGLVGARGHTGLELMRLIAGHPALELDFVVSRELAGKPVGAQVAGVDSDLCYEALDAGQVAARGADVVILALPNDKSGRFVDAINDSGTDPVIVDLSADHRFDRDWYYGLPELTRDAWRGQRRVSNPGCYATAMQLSLAPLKGLLAAPPVCFGVSGYSGAGTTPSDRNDPEKLRDNLMPYALTGHIHEKEASWQLSVPVEFMPHVAPHFRGLSVTSNVYLSRALTRDEVVALFREAYAHEPLVRVSGDAPWVSRIAGRQHAEIGGFAVSADGRRVVLVATLDNLLKGAATQAVQNINRVLGMAELDGIVLPDADAASRGHGEVVA
ncbi:MAG: N-acetyl-gamma-glutamyl-phosphate reductase [Rhodanobacteraceae bacterium]